MALWAVICLNVAFVVGLVLLSVGLYPKKRTKFLVVGFDVSRAALGRRRWFVIAEFKVPSADQFTDICESYSCAGRWLILTILKAHFGARRKYWRLCDEALPIRSAKGWR